MSHYAKVLNGIVEQVIVAEEDVMTTFVDTSPGEWIQCSYNGNIRKNYPGIGYTYDSTRDAFIGPKPYTSWSLNETSCTWEPPVVYPDDSLAYDWNEETTSWDQVDG